MSINTFKQLFNNQIKSKNIFYNNFSWCFIFPKNPIFNDVQFIKHNEFLFAPQEKIPILQMLNEAIIKYNRSLFENSFKVFLKSYLKNKDMSNSNKRIELITQNTFNSFIKENNLSTEEKEFGKYKTDKNNFSYSVILFKKHLTENVAMLNIKFKHHISPPTRNFYSDILGKVQFLKSIKSKRTNTFNFEKFTAIQGDILDRVRTSLEENYIPKHESINFIDYPKIQLPLTHNILDRTNWKTGFKDYFDIKLI